MIVRQIRRLKGVLTGYLTPLCGFQTEYGQTSFETYWKFMRSAEGPGSKGMLTGLSVILKLNCLLRKVSTYLLMQQIQSHNFQNKYNFISTQTRFAV
jgi:hypothetical protein